MSKAVGGGGGGKGGDEGQEDKGTAMVREEEMIELIFRQGGDKPGEVCVSVCVRVRLLHLIK